MVKNCFTCSKCENCNDYDVCDKGSLWKGKETEPERRTCDNCANKSPRGCKKTAYYISGCINKEYKLWEHET